MSVQRLPDDGMLRRGVAAVTPSASTAADVEPGGRHAIADLSDQHIESMTNSGLAELIRGSDHPWDDREMERHLRYADRSTLLRLAYLVRNCCQNAECAALQQALLDELDRPLNRRCAGTLSGNPR